MTDEPDFMRQARENAERIEAEVDQVAADTEQIGEGLTEETAQMLEGFLSQSRLPDEPNWMNSAVSRQFGSIPYTDIDRLADALARDDRVALGRSQEDARNNLYGVLTQSVINHQKTATLAWFNSRYFIVRNVGGKCRIGEWNDGKGMDLDSIILWQPPREFQDGYAGDKIFLGWNESNPNPKLMGKGKWWFEQENRRIFDKLAFDTQKGEDADGNLNLWRGWGVQPKAGEWPLLRAHIENVLANGDKECSQYILKWAAWAFQNPDEPCEVALVFRGKQRTGKGTFGRLMNKIFNYAGSHITDPRSMSSRFNNHLMGICLAFLDEVVRPENKAIASMMKALLTEPRLKFEGKGIDLIGAKNRLKVIMATNHDWVVSAETDDHRYSIFDVSNAHASDKQYFDALFAEIDGGGAAAFLHDLLEMDLKGWHPRQDLPETAAKVDQKRLSLDPPERVFNDLLLAGEFPIAISASGMKTGLFVAASIIREVAQKRYNVDFDDAKCTALMESMGCVRDSQFRASYGRLNYWKLPSLEAARVAWSSNELDQDWPEIMQYERDASDQDETDYQGWAPMPRSGF